MATTRTTLSGSTNGRGIKIAATATPGSLIHTAHASDLDEIHLFAVNSTEIPERLIIEWGGTTSPDDLFKAVVPPNGVLDLVTDAQGLVLTGGLAVRAYSETTNDIVIHGFVNRISP